MSEQNQERKGVIRTKRTVAKMAIKILKVDDLKIDPSYQRGVVKKHTKIVKDFMAEALGTITVGEREDGSLWVVDGQQRVTALKALGKKEVRADVFASQGPEHEAEVFRVMNKNRTALKPLELFHAALAAGDDEAWTIKKIVEEYGFRIKTSTGISPASNYAAETLSSMIGAISTVETVFKRGGGDALRFVMSVLKDAWPGDSNRTVDAILYGLYGFWTARGKDVNLERLVPRLNTTTPAKVLSQAQLGVGDRRANVAEIILKLYRKAKV